MLFKWVHSLMEPLEWDSKWTSRETRGAESRAQTLTQQVTVSWPMRRVTAFWRAKEPPQKGCSPAQASKFISSS